MMIIIIAVLFAEIAHNSALHLAQVCGEGKFQMQQPGGEAKNYGPDKVPACARALCARNALATIQLHSNLFSNFTVTVFHLPAGRPPAACRRTCALGAAASVKYNKCVHVRCAQDAVTAIFGALVVSRLSTPPDAD